MRPGLKAFLLSAFVFPGLGQLYNQDRRKGVALVLGTNLLLGVALLVGMVLFSQEYSGGLLPPPPDLGTGQGPAPGYPVAPAVLDPLRPAHGRVGLRHGGRGPGRRAVKQPAARLDSWHQQCVSPLAEDLSERCA